MTGHVDSIRMTAYREKSPAAVFNSFSEFARTMVQENPTEWEAVERAWNERRTDPTAYDLNRNTHEEAFQDLIKAAAKAVDIACSTLVTMVEFANKTTFSPDFIVVDEAARLSENLLVAVQAKWPNAPCLLISDTKQFPPMALAKQQKGFRAIFANQREGLHELDPKRLQQASPDDDGDPPDTYELKVGHSYANDINARYVTQMLVEMYRSETLMDARDAKLMATDNENLVRRPSVLILAPYSVQKSAYDLSLRGMSVAEIPKDLVDVRTVDDSPGHEADIVIIDCVCVSRLGFVGNAHRMAVMMTRARVGTIIVGPGAKVIDNAAFADLRAYINDPLDAISVRKADRITANDGIERSIGSIVVTQSSDKRVKKNKSDRRQRFAKPGKTEDDNVFKKTLRDARRLAADDSDSEEDET
ncbi:hypothetical protein NW767_008023 [Fusarium falciforme]|nr:hypothetical protein NW767_008023 [Fusarium falciforme]